MKKRSQSVRLLGCLSRGKGEPVPYTTSHSYS